ncbi:molybdopterin cofactor-binding domain-containing protein [Komagataeibacter swingsii]|uniref:Aldehyde dehydrogenase n=1 Tax=Komagataeibacter swingsii TaxID=215220 RepID=A0A2V4RTC0_9PROT|nr:molybdopterin cofactor-binding domain-containing protein [Komagataeibacter swingsii]PYD70887.1 aldehyde dehydrogenase [Komagataeibacter swingsii]GBQ60700.1 aldehyde dehydrogenase large subunit [Komagataeibacter swingsii DSM 16373]
MTSKHPSSPAIRRRQVLGGAGAFVLAAILPAGRSRGAGMLVEDATAPFAPNAYIRIGSDNVITMILPNIEMGQGIYTSSVMLMAEELGVDPQSVRIEAAPPGGGAEITGGSTSSMTEWMPLRQAGAAARAMLQQAAAARWSCAPDACVAQDGYMTGPAGQRLPYGELAAEAAKLPVPKDVALKTPAQFRLIGRPMHRLDSQVKVDGQATFGIDAQVPGQKVGAVAACPVIGGHVGHVDTQAALKIRGVVTVLQIEDAVCVVADHYWAARKGLAALDVQWVEGPNAAVDTQAIYRQLEGGLSGPAILADHHGDTQQAMTRAHGRYSATYRQPLLAHATMEPINCTIHVRPDGCDIWTGTQVAERARDTTAEVTGLPKDRIKLHSQYIGGGFGRRLEHEYVTQAARFGRQVSYPLKIIWSREEDITRDRFRPAYLDHLEAGLDERGYITGLTHRIVGPAVVARWEPSGLGANGYDDDLSVGTVITPYTYPAYRLEFARREPPGVITAWWRGVGGTRGLFVVEGFIDELAQRAGIDPVAYRREMVRNNPRALAVLERVARESGWGAPLPPNCGRGVALQFAFGSYLATVVEVEMPAPHDIRIRRVTCAVDCGQVINPDQIAAQIEGGLIFGFSAALYNEITLEKGRVQQDNFHTWRVMRMNEAPKRIDVHLIESGESPGGIGETGTAAAAPALANAMAAVQKRRYRYLPLLSPLNQPSGHEKEQQG